MAESNFQKAVHWFQKHIWFPVIMLFLIAEFFIDPIGEFCLNDDWAYSKVISHYLDTGEFKFSFWQAIPGLPMIFTGIFLSKLFGFSFTLLRLISVGCLIAISIIIDIDLKRLGVNSITRLMILLLFVFNPLSIALGNTFMPDIFQLCLGAFAVHFMLKYVSEERIGSLVLFAVFSVLATLNRQTGIVISVIFPFIALVNKRASLKRFLFVSVPLLISFFSLSCFEYLAIKNNVLPLNYNLQMHGIYGIISEPSFASIQKIGYYFITSSLCLGLFILPLTISGWRQAYDFIRNTIIGKLTFVFYFVLIGVKVFYSGNIFPFVGNMFYHLGIGPVYLTGFVTDDILDLPLHIKWIWGTLNFVGGFSFYVSLMSILNFDWRERGLESNSVRFFFLLLLLVYLVPLCFNYANDRYLLFLLPFYFVAYTLSNKKRPSIVYYLIFFIPVFYFSIAGTHDYLSLSRARASATDYLLNKKSVIPQNIDGGFEFNGFNAENTKNYLPSHKGRWWFINNDEYVISPFKQANYSEDTSIYFRSWMSYDFNQIIIQQKE